MTQFHALEYLTDASHIMIARPHPDVAGELVAALVDQDP